MYYPLIALEYVSSIYASSADLLSAQGLTSIEIFDRAMEYYTKDWTGLPGVVIEHDGMVKERLQGEIKTVLAEKKYGFIRIAQTTKDIFFSFRNLPRGTSIQKGDAVSFFQATDPRNGKRFASDIQLESDKPSNIQVKVFSMSMPFAAFLMNGVKTLETRKNPMFEHCKPGSKLLIHVGQRDFDDKNRHFQILEQKGLKDEQIHQLKSMPRGFTKGTIVGICEVGKTYELSLGQRCDPLVEEQVLAFGADSGKIVTEIRRVEFLKQPLRSRGKPGIFSISIDPSILPDGWNNEATAEEEPSKLVYSITG